MFARSIPASLRAERDLLEARIRRVSAMLDHPDEFPRSRAIMEDCLAELREELGIVSAALALHAPGASAEQRAAFLALAQDGGAA